MYCVNCGKKNTKTAKFCQSCGMAVGKAHEEDGKKEEVVEQIETEEGRPYLVGKIGRKIAHLCTAMGLKVIGYNRSKTSLTAIDLVPLRRIFQEADIIVIACAYKKGENDDFINSELLSLAKKDSLLISIAHPNLIDINYLITHVDKFRGIGFDYLVTDQVRELLKKRSFNIIVTPHLGSQSTESIANMTETMIDAAMSFAEGNPQYLVNG